METWATAAGTWWVIACVSSSQWEGEILGEERQKLLQSSQTSCNPMREEKGEQSGSRVTGELLKEKKHLRPFFLPGAFVAVRNWEPVEWCNQRGERRPIWACQGSNISSENKNPVLRIKILPWKVQLFFPLVFPCFSWPVLSVLCWNKSWNLGSSPGALLLNRINL